MPFPSPETVAQHIADTLAAAEYAAVYQADLAKAGARLFWNGGDLDRAIGPLTVREFNGPLQDVLVLYAEALQCIGRPDLIAARHLRMAAQLDRRVAGIRAEIADDEAKITRLKAQNAEPRTWLTQHWDDNSAVISLHEGIVSALKAAIPRHEAAAAQLRARAAELVAVKRAA